MPAMSADDLNAITDPNAFRKAALELGLTVRVTSSDGQKRPYRRKPHIVEDYRRQLAESQCQSGSACGPDMQVDEQVAETASNPRETPPTGPFSHSQDFVVGGKRCAICCTPCRTGLTVADGCPWTVCSLQCKLRANDRWIEAKLSSPDASASAATSGKSASLLRTVLLKQCRPRLLPRRSPLAASRLSQVLLRLTVREDTQPSANQLSAAVSTFASGRVSSQSSPVSPCKQERLFCHGFSLQQGPAAVPACHSRVFFRAIQGIC